MSSKRTLFTAMTLVSALSLPLWAQAKPEAQAEAKADAAPRLTLVEPLKDFGTVPKGEKLDWSFVVKNTGTADLQILSAQPACGCTVAEFDKVIKPGQTGKVVAHVDTTNFAGPISKTVALATNDPNTPNAQLTVHAVVKPYVEASPAGFVRYSLLHGDAATQSVKIYTEEEAPFEILGIDVPGDYVKATFKKIEKEEERVMAGRPGQNQYLVDVTVGGPDVKPGPLAEKIKIRTNSKHQPEYMVSLTGIIRPRVSMTPTIVNFGEVAPGEAAATRSVIVATNDKTAAAEFKVTKVESNLKGVKAEAKPTTTPGEYEVFVSVPKDSAAGEVDGKIKVFTSDKSLPFVEIPVKGTIKKM
jgi:hypothetical protein